MTMIVGQRASNTATRTSNLSGGTCRWYSDGYLMYLFFDGIRTTADVPDAGKHDKPLFTGLPKTRGLSHCALNSTSDSCRVVVVNGSVYARYSTIKAKNEYFGMAVDRLA